MLKVHYCKNCNRIAYTAYKTHRCKACDKRCITLDIDFTKFNKMNLSEREDYIKNNVY